TAFVRYFEATIWYQSSLTPLRLRALRRKICCRNHSRRLVLLSCSPLPPAGSRPRSLLNTGRRGILPRRSSRLCSLRLLLTSRWPEKPQIPRVSSLLLTCSPLAPTASRPFVSGLYAPIRT